MTMIYGWATADEEVTCIETDGKIDRRDFDTQNGELLRTNPMHPKDEDGEPVGCWYRLFRQARTAQLDDISARVDYLKRLLYQRRKQQKHLVKMHEVK